MLQASLLSSIPYFSDLPPETLDQIRQTALKRQYKAGEIVFLQGEAVSGLYLVESGWLKSIKTSAAGREQVVRYVGPGETFNEIGVLVETTNQVTMMALEDTILWVILHQVMVESIDKQPALAQKINQYLARRVLYLMSLVEDLSLHSVETRLARFLLESAEGAALMQHRWATQNELAARLGTVPDVLNRALKKLAEEGLVEVRRHQIRILDRQGLEGKAARID